MPKWKYRVEPFVGSDKEGIVQEEELTEWLDAVDADGWELIGHFSDEDYWIFRKARVSR
jgi:hypothetical protein